MSNTLTNLIEVIYQALNIVSQEQIGMIPAVASDMGVEQVAKNQTIRWPVAPSASVDDIAAAATGPDPTAQTIGNADMAITKERSGTFFWTGNEQAGLGKSYQVILRDQFAEQMRKLANEIESDLCALYPHASRAYGTAGATPFGTAGDFTDAAETARILKDNGAPANANLVFNTAAGAKIRGKQSQAYMQGDGTLLRQGVLLDIHGMPLRESAQIKTHSKGSQTLLTTTGATTYNRAGAVVLRAATGASTGAVAYTAGDVISIADHAGVYVVAEDITAAAAETVSIKINKPGLIANIADGKAITVTTSNPAANMCFARNAIRLVTRLPMMPEGGDAADDVQVVQHPASGLAFQVAMYRQRRRVAYEVGIAWGVKAVNPEHIALLLG